MRILYVWGDDDYHALSFEKSDLTIKEIVESIDKGEWLDQSGIYEWSDNDNYFYVKILDFKDVDPAFIEFIINEIMDEDDMKHRNFYIIKEEQ